MKKIPYESHDILICECNSTEHQIVVNYSEERLPTGSEYETIYIHIHLNKRPFWERLKYAFKYIFGYKCKFGAFDEFIINPNDADKIQEIVDYLKRNKDEKIILG